MNIKNTMGKIAVVIAGPLALAALVANADVKQPPIALDPTYGRAIPRRVAEPKRIPDATWIWSERTLDNQTIYARGRFSLARVPRKAVLYVTADNQFVAHVNGKKVGQTPTDPRDSDLWKKVQAIDITAQLKSGANIIAIQAHNAGVAAGLVVRLETDGKLALTSDRKWRVSENPPADTWVEPAFDDTRWAPATEKGRVGEGAWGGNLQGWPVELSTVPRYLSHISIAPVRWAYAGDPDHLEWRDTTSQMTIERPAGSPEGTSWRVVIDFGKELTGRVLTESKTPGLILGTGESTGEVLAKPWTTTAGSATPYTALRYASVTVPGQEKRISLKAEMDHLYYPVRYQGSFDCSDPLLTRVWYTGAYTAHLCMQDDIWDAPKRDRWRWMGDLHVAGEVINNVFADRFLMEQTMARLRQDAQGGHPTSELPAGHINGITGYSYSWIAGLADYYRHLGARDYLKSQHTALVSMLEFCAQEIDPQGDFTNRHKAWVFVDWSPELGQESPAARATTQLFLVKALREGVYLLRELGDQPNAAKYAALAERVHKASQAHLLAADGTFGNRKQANAMAIYSGVATPAQAANIFASGLFKPDTGPKDFNVSPYYGNYVLHAMGMAGRTQDGLDYVRSFYGQMVRDGATTFYEHYDPAWEKRNFHSHLQWGENDNAAAGYHVSLCHGWSAGPTTFLSEYILGIQPTGAGFTTCSIAPRLGDLNWASGSVPTPRGNIQIRIERQPAGLMLKVTIPRGTTATVTLPTAIRDINGKKVQGASVEIGSGTFIITGS